MEDQNTGVTADASTATGFPSVSADTGGQEATSTTAAGTDPAQPVAENVGGADAGAESLPVTEEELAQAPEQWRDKFTSLLKGYKSLETDHKPLKSWVEQRGGLEYIQTDVEMVDRLFSPNLEDRQQAYASLYQDEAAFGRIFEDFVTDPDVQRAALQNIDPQTLLRYVEDAGLLPQGYGSQVDPAVLATIPNELQDVFRSLPTAVQEDYAAHSPELRNWNLRRDAQLYNSQRAERERAQREQQHYHEQRAQAAYEQKSKVYNDVRTIIQQALAEKIPGNEEALKFVLNATETSLYQSPEGAALWNELETHIDTGNVRELRQKLPLIVAKAKQIATSTATWLNGMESKARQFDELMRLSNYDDIIRYVNQLRGGMKQPGPGTTPAPTNGNHMPKPELAGQYDRDNILSYGRRS